MAPKEKKPAAPEKAPAKQAKKGKELTKTESQPSKKATATKKKRGRGRPPLPPEKKKERGRPSKFNPEVANTIVLAIRAGNYMETAAAHAGVNKDTLHDWLRRGARGEKPYIEFSDSVKKALADAEMTDVMLVGKAAQAGAWQAAAWRLERRNRKRWGKHIKVELDKLNPDELSDEELDAILSGTADSGSED